MFLSLLIVLFTFSSSHVLASETEIFSVLEHHKKTIHKWNEHHNTSLSPTAKMLTLQILSENILHSKTSSTSSDIGLLSDRLFPGLVSYLHSVDEYTYNTEKLDALHQDWNSKLQSLRQNMCPFEKKHLTDQACLCAPLHQPSEAELFSFIFNHDLPTLLNLVNHFTFHEWPEDLISQYLQHMVECPQNNKSQRILTSVFVESPTHSKIKCCPHICMPQTPDYTLDAYAQYRYRAIFNVQSWLFQNTYKKDCIHSEITVSHEGEDYCYDCYDCYEKYQ